MRLIVFSFNPLDFYGEIIAELEPLRASDAVRVTDALAVYQPHPGNPRRQGRDVTKKRPTMFGARKVCRRTMASPTPPFPISESA
jgi:hypothetical protein